MEEIKQLVSATKPGGDEEFIPTRKTLLSRLKDLGDQESWRTFFNTYWKLIYGVAIKAGLSPAEAQDVVQETVIAVVRNIGTFRYDPERCAFKSWLLQVTRSRISNQFRRNKRYRLLQEPADGRTPVMEQIPDASATIDAIWDEEWQRNLMDAAIARVKRQVDAEQFQIFDFYVLKQWPVRKVAASFKVSAGYVYLVKHRVSKLIRKQIEQLETKSW